MRLSLFILSLLIITVSVQAQCTLTLSGHIHDSETKEHLDRATIAIKELKQVTITDSAGNFHFQGLCAGRYTLIFSHAGCVSVVRHIHLKSDYELDILLEHQVSQLKDVVIQGESGNQNIMAAETIKGLQLKATRGLSLAESIKGISGVSMLQTGTNIYKPVIHGLHSNRVLILNNGIRQEGQIGRAHV